MKRSAWANWLKRCSVLLICCTFRKEKRTLLKGKFAACAGGEMMIGSHPTGNYLGGHSKLQVDLYNKHIQPLVPYWP